MAYELPNDVVRTIPIVSMDAAGAVVPAPAGVVYTAVSSDPASMQAVIQGSNVVINALVRAATGLSLTVDDSGPLAAFVLSDISIVDDVAPKSVGLDTTAQTDVPQAVPAA